MEYVQKGWKKLQWPKFSFRKLNKDEKGLTLIELLAVIVILGIIAAIAIPSISAIIKNSERKSQLANAHQMVDAARMAIAAQGMQNIGTYTNPANGEAQTVIKLQDLVDSGYINGLIKDPYAKGVTYNGTDSTVTVKQKSTSTSGVVTDKVDFFVTVKSMNGDVYFSNVAEDDIDNLGASGNDVDLY